MDGHHRSRQGSQWNPKDSAAPLLAWLSLWAQEPGLCGWDLRAGCGVRGGRPCGLGHEGDTRPDRVLAPQKRRPLCRMGAASSRLPGRPTERHTDLPIAQEPLQMGHSPQVRVVS